MWYETENGDNIRPAEIDATSSHVYVYIRRNIERVPEETVGEEVRPAHYRWEEARLPKDALPIIEKMLAHDAMLAEVEDDLTNTQLALCEIYESGLV